MLRSTGVWRDTRFALRALCHEPLFTAAALVTLALGIGANTAVFSIVKAVLLNQLPYRDPGRLVTIVEADGRTPHPQGVAAGTAEDWRARGRSFESLSLWHDFATRPIVHGQAEFLRGMRVNADFFDALGIRMHLGRSFLAEEDRPDTRNKLILSYGLWMRRFGGDPGVIGRVLPATGDSFTIVGVLPPDFHPLHMSNPGEAPELFAPLGVDAGDLACRTCRWYRLIGRLKPGVTAAQAQAEMNAIERQVAREHPVDYAQDATVIVTPLRVHLVGRFETALWVLLGAAGLLLLLACANVASLLAARATRRETEIAVRAALGAGRWRLARQMLTESLVLSLAGGAAGIALAWLATRAIPRLGAPEIPRLDEIGPDGAMLAFGLAISLATGLLFGMAPALRQSQANLHDALKGGGSSGRPSRHRSLSVLVIAEIAIAFVLVLGVGLLGNSYVRIMSVNPGFDPRNIVTLSLLPDFGHFNTDERRLGYYDAVVERMRDLPGADAAGYSSTLPLSNPDARRLYIYEHAHANEAEAPRLDTYFASPGYFAAMRIPLLRGRGFSERDSRASEPVALVSESCARTQFPGEDPIGKHVQSETLQASKPWARIVGVVGDVHQYGLDRQPDAAVYFAFAQAEYVQEWARLVVRSKMDAVRSEPAVRAALMEVDPRQPLFHVQPMDAYIAKSLADRTFTLALIAVFGGLALALATVGVYGVISYSVGMRTREVGIRMALGAGSGDVLRMILREVLGMTLAGLAVGLAGSWVSTPLLGNLLFGLKPTDPATAVGVAALLVAIALAASALPAWRATRLDPTTVLRME